MGFKWKCPKRDNCNVKGSSEGTFFGNAGKVLSNISNDCQRLAKGAVQSCLVPVTLQDGPTHGVAVGNKETNRS